ncbi:hypothetical protein ARMSODRAFT_964997 [Armillaria solidipes]|uniref:Uncharacterized protein n=1 Tax=Armillaria solidipes TaxID=1076256 RepID=A0A2H3B5Z8_9AGAR|nr:hypothetical protein ARMSODRAFT_964997 [Armillaria solidipes]
MPKLVWWPFVVAYASSVVLGNLAVDTPYVFSMSVISDGYIHALLSRYSTSQ